MNTSDSDLPGLIPTDMRDALKEFDREAGILDAFLASLEACEPPTIIYHYTNDVGLRGILETGQFWLTDIFNLNDPSELGHGISRAQRPEYQSGLWPARKQALCQRFVIFDSEGVTQRSGHYFMCSSSSAVTILGNGVLTPTTDVAMQSGFRRRLWKMHLPGIQLRWKHSPSRTEDVRAYRNTSQDHRGLFASGIAAARATLK